ncbi:MAG: Gfo/Idh/MocA family oxidoreductase [Clostridiales bacterium]|nr:Gfo/Idh/MocA family oxidoreductase [Clostridiales bacterium]
MDKVINAAIIGYGYMGRFHQRKLAGTKGVILTGVFDTDPNRSDEATVEGLTVYETAEDLFNDPAIDLVLICTPNDSHAAYAIAALAKGKHVMCEKPVTMNAKELEDVICAAVASGRKFTTHQNRRWDRDFLAVKKVAESRNIGSPTTIESKVFGQRGVCFGWRALPEHGGGMLMDWGVHLIDQALLMLEGHRVISVRARLMSILTPAVDDYFELSLRFDNQMEYHITVGTFALQPQPRWFMHGDRGTLKIDTFDPHTASMKRIKQDVRGFDSVFEKEHLGPSRTMAPLKPEFIEELVMPITEDLSHEYHRNLVAAINGQEELHVRWDQMLHVMHIIDLAKESSKKNTVLLTQNLYKDGGYEKLFGGLYGIRRSKPASKRAV